LPEQPWKSATTVAVLDKPSLLLYLQLVSLFPQLTLPKLPACHARVTWDIAPSANLSPIFSTPAATPSQLMEKCRRLRPEALQP